jgi:hypothetical protein
VPSGVEVAMTADGNKVFSTNFSSGGFSTIVSGTTLGTLGSISGGQYESVDLQYIGNNKFLMREKVGNLSVQ